MCGSGRGQALCTGVTELSVRARVFELVDSPAIAHRSAEVTEGKQMSFCFGKALGKACTGNGSRPGISLSLLLTSFSFKPFCLCL